MSILVAIFNVSQLPYDAKREALGFMLDKIQKRLLLKNKELLDKKIDENKIKAFIQTMQTFATKEPLVKSSAIKKFLLTVLIIGAVVGIGYLVWIYLIEPKKAVVKEWFQEFLNPAEATAKRLLKEVKKDFPEMFQDCVHKLVMKKQGDGPEVSNPDLELAGEKIGAGVAKGAALALPRWLLSLLSWNSRAPGAVMHEGDGNAAV
jgi:hypothetical protein